MSLIFSTQKRQTFLRRKYCFFPTAAALSPPVGRCEAAIGRPPLGSGIYEFSFVSVATGYGALDTGAAATGAPGAGCAGAGAPGSGCAPPSAVPPNICCASEG